MDFYTLTRLGEGSGLDEKSSLRLYQRVHMKADVQIDVDPEVLLNSSANQGITVDLDQVHDVCADVVAQGAKPRGELGHCSVRLCVCVGGVLHT